METTPAPTKGILSNLLGDVQVDTVVGVSTADLTKIGATLFIAACLIFMAYFTFKKFLQ